MTDVASALPSAGWYDDPTDATSLRWWDGAAWTGNAAPKKPVIAPTAPPLASSYSVDRAALSPRRAARLAEREAEREAEHLATVTPLHPAPSGVAMNVPQPAAPQTVVPPSADTQAAVPLDTVTAEVAPAESVPAEAVSTPHMPQLGLVPTSVDAPTPTEVAVSPSLDPLAVPSEAFPVPQPGSVLTGPPTSAIIAEPKRPVAAHTAAPSSELTAAPTAPLPADAAPALPTATTVPSFSNTPFFTAAATAATAAPTATPAAPATPARAFVAPTAAPAFAAPPPAPTLSAPAPAAPASTAVARVAPTPSTRPVQVAAQSLAPRTSATGAARLLAFTPWLIAADVAAAGYLAIAHPRWFLVAAAAFAVGIIGSLVLADLDRRALRKQGWERSAPPLMIVLSWVVYIVARQLVLRRQGARIAPLLIVTAVNLVLSAAALTATAMFVAPHAVTVLRATVLALI